MNKQDLIFIVEDDSFYAMVLKSYLEFSGYTNIDVYHSGKGCLKALHKCPKLILMDYNLGDLLGRDILLEVVAFDPNIPVVFISGQESIQDAIVTLKLGAFDYIQKNDSSFVKLDNILEKIEESKSLIKAYDKKRREIRNAVIMGGVMLLIIITVSMFSF